MRLPFHSFCKTVHGEVLKCLAARPSVRKIRLDNKAFLVKLTAKQFAGDERKYYDHRLTEIKELAGGENSADQERRGSFSQEEATQQPTIRVQDLLSGVKLRDISSTLPMVDANWGKAEVAAPKKTDGLRVSKAKGEANGLGAATVAEAAAKFPGLPVVIHETTALSMFRKNAPNLNDIATSLRDRGFEVQTPDDVLNLVDEALRGFEVWSAPAQDVRYAKASEVHALASPQPTRYDGSSMNLLTQRKSSPVSYERMLEQANRSAGNLGDSSPAMPIFFLGYVDRDEKITPLGWKNRERLEAAASTLSAAVQEQLMNESSN